MRGPGCTVPAPGDAQLHPKAPRLPWQLPEHPNHCCCLEPGGGGTRNLGDAPKPLGAILKFIYIFKISLSFLYSAQPSRKVDGGGFGCRAQRHPNNPPAGGHGGGPGSLLHHSSPLLVGIGCGFVRILLLPFGSLAQTPGVSAPF